MLLISPMTILETCSIVSFILNFLTLWSVMSSLKTSSVLWLNWCSHEDITVACSVATTLGIRSFIMIALSEDTLFNLKVSSWKHLIHHKVNHIWNNFQQIQRAERMWIWGWEPPSQGFLSICKWVKPVFLLGCYICIFHGTGNSAQLCQNSRISGYTTMWHYMFSCLVCISIQRW
jgi:hypothetical protein